MSSDFDWLDFLSLLSPKCSLLTLGAGGISRVTREDVIGALAGISALSSMLVFARVEMLEPAVLVDGTVDSAYIAALELAKDDVRRYSLDEFLLAWKVVLLEEVRGDACPACDGKGRVSSRVCVSCGGSGVIQYSASSRAAAAGVSRSKWARLQPLHPICSSVVSDCWSEVRSALRHHLSSRGELAASVGVGGIKSLQSFPL